MPSSWWQRNRGDGSGPFHAICILLVAAFLLGGGSRSNIESLVFLRPIAILLLGYGLAGLQLSHIMANRFLLAMAIAILGLLVLQLVPLPPGLWGRLPGRELVLQIDRAAGLGQIWRPLSLAPDATRNALYATLVPLAVLVLGVRLGSRERYRLLVLILVLGGLSALLGLAQSLDGMSSFLYFYKVTNNGAAVGLFANRNHQALLLVTLLPMLAVWASGLMAGKRRNVARGLPILLAGITLLPLILVTGSRAGLLLAATSLLLIPAVFADRSGRSGTGSSSPARRFNGVGTLLPVLGIAVFCLLLVLLTIWLGRGLAWDRLLKSTPVEDMRFLIVPTLAAMIRLYLPLGSGFGSFERVYQVHEPDRLLQPTYANHAHNDWLEIALTGGIPAMTLLLVAIIVFCLRVRALFARGLAPSRELNLARLGLLVIFLMALASLGDYPLRVPSLACFFVVAVLWASCPLPKNQPNGAVI